MKSNRLCGGATLMQERIMLLVAVAHAADCPPVSSSTWRAHLDAAEAAYAALDSRGFDDAVDGAALDLPCVVELVPATDVARWHALIALRHYTDGRTADVIASLGAAAASSPTWSLSKDLVPDGHELRSWTAAPPGATQQVPAPTDGATWFDGTQTSARPTQRPTVFQLRRRDGSVATTRYLRPEDDVPPYASAAPVVTVIPVPVPVPASPAPAPAPRVVEQPTPAPAPAPVPVPLVTPERHPRPLAWTALVAGIAAGGTSAGLYAGAIQAESRFLGPTPEQNGWGWNQLSQQRSTVNGLSTGSAICAGAATAGITAGILGLVVGR